ncbi:hypothetical protein BH10PAT4_BH10PAT4_1150 [soil metagenome]
MDDNEEVQAEDTGYWSQHRFFLLVGMSITIALVLVAISMTLYATSGAAQLDLSRPGYKSIISQAVNTDGSFGNYSSVGKLDQASINEFKTLYDKQSAQAKAVDAFSGDPLDPDLLEISVPSTQQ